MVEQVSTDMLLKEMDQLQSTLNATPETPSTGAAGDDFKEVLGKLIDDVDQAQKVADVSLKKLAAGDESASIQDVVMKLEEADVSFRLMKEIRDKLMSAYKEVMGMST
jgi:flagellar hook-basal body complex protein FliE